MDRVSAASGAIGRPQWTRQVANHGTPSRRVYPGGLDCGVQTPAG